MYSVENLSNKISFQIGTTYNKDADYIAKLNYGLQVLFLSTTKLILLLIIGYFLNILIPMVIAIGSFSIIRRFAFGLHCSSSRSCSIITVLVFVGQVYLFKFITVNPYILYAIAAMSLLILYKYAPADTKKRPIVSKKLRKKLRLKSVITACILITAALITPNYLYKTIIIVNLFIEALCTLPLTYKIFGREINNYEKFSFNN